MRKTIIILTFSLTQLSVKSQITYLSTIPEFFTNYAVVSKKNVRLPIIPITKQNTRYKNGIHYFTNYSSNFCPFHRQKIIPIIKPYENKTLEFVEKTD